MKAQRVKKMAEGGVAGVDGMEKNPNPLPLQKPGPTAGLAELLQTLPTHQDRPEQLMDARARNRQEMGLPATEGAASDIMSLVPIIGLLKNLGQAGDAKERMANPEYLRNTVGKELGTNYMRGSPSDTFGKEANVQMMAQGGEVEAAEEQDPADIPEDIKEYVEKSHKMAQESRPDEAWRITPPAKEDSIAPYKQDEEEAAADAEGEAVKEMPIPHFAEGGEVPDEAAILQKLEPQGAGLIAPGIVPQAPNPPPMAPPPPASPPMTPAPKPPMAPLPAPALTDQDFMNRANKMLGVGPDQQAGFMKLLGDRSQKAQLGAGLAGIGDAIASGGTLGKVNPGGMARSEDLIQSRENAGINGMQTIRGNQEKAMEVADKLEARDPKSPLSKWAQKAYGDDGRKIGIDLSNASAALIGDVTGKGVEALNTQYQNQLKMMGLDLQKKQVEATIGNQKAERDIAREGHQLSATEKLGSRTLGNKIEGIIPGTSANTEKKALERIANGDKGPAQANSRAEYDALPSGTHYVDSFGTEKVKK